MKIASILKKKPVAKKKVVRKKAAKKKVGATNRQKKVLKNKYLISRALEKQDYSTAKKKRISTRRLELTKKTQKVFDKVKKSEVEALKSTLFYISKTENEINNYVNFLLTDGKGLSISEKNGYRKMIKQKKQLLSEYKTHAKELKKLI